MQELPRFQLEKLKIHVFRDNKREGQPMDTLEAMFNPESYSQTYENSYVNNYKGIRTSGRKAQFKFARPEYLNLTLLLDHTMITPTYQNKDNVDIYQKVENFLKITSYVDGEIGEPKYLQIEWGKLMFACRLASVSVQYQFFNREGIPLRASLEAKFMKDIDDDKRQKIAEKSNNELAKIKRVDADDTLPLLAYVAYGNPNMAIDIAQANSLNSIRQLTPGTKIKIPSNK
jgi:hypothetical protein